MSQSLVSCPLCCQPTFSSTNALCLSLISIVSKCLNCPLCEEVLRGLDKLTIHLLSHLLTQTTTNNNECSFICHENKCNNFNSIVKTSESSKLQYVVNKGEQEGIDNSSGVVGSTVISFDKIGASSLIVDDEVMLFFHNPITNKNGSVNNSAVTSKTVQYLASTSNTCNHPQTTSSLHATDSASKRTDKQTDDNVYSRQLSDILYTTEQIQTQFDKNSGTVVQHCLPCATVSVSGVKTGSVNNDEKKTEFRNSRFDKNITSFLNTNLDEFCRNQPDVEVLENELPKGGEIAVSKLSNCCSKTNLVNKHNVSTGQGTTKLVAGGEKTPEVFCKVCLLRFPDNTMLSVHESIAHSSANASEESKKKMYECQLCAKAFKMKGSLMVHTRVAHSPGSAAAIAKLVEAKQQGDSASSSSCGSAPGSPQFNCSTCGKAFKKEYHLVQHEKTHEGKQWECDICLKSFTTKYFLKKHKRLHTGEMPYMCTICNKSFTFQQSYHKHLLYHNDDKPYSCCDCGRAFKELSTLHNHQRIHTGEKPFSCEHCGVFCMIVLCLCTDNEIFLITSELSVR